MRINIVILLAILAAALAQADNTVPMLDVGGGPMVDVRINGKGPYPLILDTGATDTGPGRPSRSARRARSLERFRCNRQR
jgi:beta-lactamase superfamily II metal-dependent hydrolase